MNRRTYGDRGGLHIVWPLDYHAIDGECDPVGVRAINVATPYGSVHLEFWLMRRRDGGPHAEFIPAQISRLPAETKLWLRRHIELVDQAMLEVVRREWP